MPGFLEMSQMIQGCSHIKVTPAVRKDGGGLALGALSATLGPLPKSILFCSVWSVCSLSKLLEERSVLWVAGKLLR